jgi:hypothetical protein
MNFTDNQALPADDLNNAFYSSIAKSTKLISNNLIRQLQDRTIELTKNEFAEAYIDAEGRLDSVDTVNTTAGFLTNVYNNFDLTTAFSGTNYDPNSVTNPNNAFDSNDTTYAEKTTTITTGSGMQSAGELGKTFTEKTVKILHYKVYLDSTYWSRTIQVIVKIKQSGDWSNFSTVYDSYVVSAQTITGNLIINSDIEGISIELLLSKDNFNNATATARWFLINEPQPEEVSIIHNIATEQFDNLKNVIGVPFASKEYYNDLDIEFKLTNTTEDTGWLNPNQMNKVTGFVDEPTKLIVKLKDSNLQEIKGFSLFNEED